MYHDEPLTHANLSTMQFGRRGNGMEIGTWEGRAKMLGSSQGINDRIQMINLPKSRINLG